MTKTLTIRGGDIHDIPSFYAEINRVFMAGEDWQLGHSLDAIDDMLRGGYGAVSGQEALKLVWQDIDRSCTALGIEATARLLREKLARPDVFNNAIIARQLAALEGGTGQTYFEIVIEIIAGHRNIELVAA